MSDEGGNTLRKPTWSNQIYRVACITFRAAGTNFQPESQYRLRFWWLTGRPIL